MITVRRSVIADADVMAKTEARALNFPWTAEQIGSAILNPHTVFFTAEFDGEYAGHLSGDVCEDECEISNIVVAEKFRRRGVAQKLFEVFLDEMRNIGAYDIYILVRYDNVPAISLYKKEGFNAIGTRKGYYKGLDAVIMRKYLL